MSLSLRIGVLMVARDEERYVARALQALAEQTRSADAVVLVDDGSADCTWAEFERFRRNGRGAQKILTLRTPGLGRARARNYGVQRLREAGVDAVVIADADDISLAHRFQDIEDHLLAHAACLVYAGQLQPVDAAGKAVGKPTSYPSDMRAARLMLRRGRNPVPHAGAAIRMSLFDRLHEEWGYDYAPECDRAQDFELLLAASEDLTCHTSPEVHVLYRSDSGDVSWRSWRHYRPYHHYALWHGTQRASGKQAEDFNTWWTAASPTERLRLLNPVHFLLLLSRRKGAVIRRKLRKSVG